MIFLGESEKDGTLSKTIFETNISRLEGKTATPAGLVRQMKHHNVPAGAVMVHRSPRGTRPSGTEICGFNTVNNGFTA